LIVARQSKIFEGFRRKGYSNVLIVVNVCLELPRNSEKYFGLVVDEFLSLRILENRVVVSTLTNLGLAIKPQIYWYMILHVGVMGSFYHSDW